MERIDKKYAIIYLDNDGEWINSEDFQNGIIKDYYSAIGLLQWNFYYIIPESKIGNKTKEEIEKNETYTRKYVVPDAEIVSFINKMFPDMTESHGTIDLIKGENYQNACELAKEAQKTNKYTSIIEGPYRNISLMETLKEFDLMRANLIRNPNEKILLYTHISYEDALAKKKFELFLSSGINK